MDEARAVFSEAAEPLLDRLPDARLSNAPELFGSAISVGIVDVVLGLEAARPVEVIERWLSARTREFSLGAAGGAAFRSKGR
jgi:hypothetical protein